MGITLYSVAILILNLLVVTFFIHPTGKQMESMLTTMVLTSSFGLAIGFIVWYPFSEKPMVATLLAIGIGMLNGILIGTKFGIKCQVEGFFSGLMASMMGVMLIMMFDIYEVHFLIMMALAFLTGITIFSVAKHYDLNYKLLFITCVIVAFIFISFPENQQEYPTHHHNLDLRMTVNYIQYH
ncbi:hypothetical protein [Tenuibacillus multivorans]|uniref:DUF4203 domain-containing protein n=1 Tax=Tenuibacillus multivorans TaxID=237069 RepID=A0A1H0B0F4_9BACI|nr:hypothetical protein [Tenuibacillus multivorans]GEL77582.1 hypothetical protein TMU01_18170 [Tenuibacillus multivorans]SDN39152.1 hypothetical protein SAMN05216498_2164 [Tenuibacillus multivorans]